jgi:NADPH-dependent 2,4-dienoyl-CoA reductase/sulfur reductase-like enzyme
MRSGRGTHAPERLLRGYCSLIARCKPQHATACCKKTIESLPLARYAVIGGGLAGLATAWHLLVSGCAALFGLLTGAVFNHSAPL